MRRSKRRFTAMAMAVLMASTCINAAAPMPAAYAAEAAAEETQEKEIAPKEYTPDMVVPMTDEAQIEKVTTALVKAMTEEEKWGFLGLTGTGKEGNAGDLPGVARLGVPRIKMYDGPAGLLYLYETTNVPEEELLAATWSEEMAKLYGTVYSTENHAMGGAAMLSAQLDVQRHPFWNRTKDQMGADQYLISALADDLVQGMQSEGGLANLKHFAVCSDEGKLMNNVRQTVDEQTLHELYLPSFESAIKNGGAMSVMSGYNMLNGRYASDDDYTLNEVLRDQWNFTGFTITDWGGNHSFTLDNGTDIEAPQNTNNNKTNADKLVEEGKFTQAEMDSMVDTAVTRILRAYAVGGYLSLVKLDDKGNVIEYEVAEDAPEADSVDLTAGSSKKVKVIDTVADVDLLASAVKDNQEKVETIAEEGMVLLKNENDVLPIAADTSVNVVGSNGTSLISGIGGERSYGTAYQMTSPYEALKELKKEDKGTVTGNSYSEVVGTVIPKENLFTTFDGQDHGAVRLYGATAASGNAVYENGQWHFNDTSATDMPGKTTGEQAAIDETIDFTTATDGSSYTYKYAKDSDMYNQFSYDKGAAYTWRTYVEIPEDCAEGDTYEFILQSIGSTASMSVFALNEDGSLRKATEENENGETVETEKILRIGNCSGGTDNQGTNWFSSDIVTKTGQSISSVSVKNVKKGQRLLITISSATKFAEKDMQLTLSWVTPKDAKDTVSNALADAAKENTTSVVFAYTGTASVGSTLEATSLKLDGAQQQMIKNVAKAAHDAGNKVVVALQSPQQVVMEDWIDEVDGVIMMYYAGQRGGAAIANILTGKVNPSGHLAYTIPAKDSDTILTYSQDAFDAFKNERELTEEEIAYDNQGGSWGPGPGGFPGMGGGTTNTESYVTDSDYAAGGSGNGGWGFPGGGGANNTTNEINYTEGIFTDYRFFDNSEEIVGKELTPAYDFGHGLSYTTFEYSDMKVEYAGNDEEAIAYDVTVKVTNKGAVAGKDVVQVYLGEAKVPEGVQMAKYQLAGFQKTKELQPGESEVVTIHVSERSLSYWDEKAEYTTRADGTKDKWTVAEGTRKVYVGTSSDDLKFDTEINITYAPTEYKPSDVKPMTDETKIEKTVNALVNEMTEAEKWGFLGLTGTGKEGNAGDLAGVARLGVPRIKLYDGPAGLLYLYETTNVPEEELLAATWSEEMANLYGTIYSTENHAMGGAAMLSAQLDVQRHPFWNRTKDQMGADQYLISALADDLVQGMQSEGGLANLKHFAVCSDEGKLMNNVRQTVDEQTLHELYLPSFESAIKNGGAMSVMSGYNMLNNRFASDDDYTLNEVLRDQWNFDGFTITDWGGNHSFTLDNGTDIEAPQNTNNNKTNADKLVAEGKFTQAEMDAMVDTAVTRILRAYAVGGYLTKVRLNAEGSVEGYAVRNDAPTANRVGFGAGSSEQVKVIDTVADVDLLASAVKDNQNKAETIAEEGMVLLKNEGNTLPIAKDQKVNIVGTNGTSLISGIGGERSYGTAYQMTSPYQAMVDLKGENNVKGYSYEEVVGTIIPEENLYTTGDGDAHGANRFYGATAASGNAVYENGQWHSNGTAATDMPGHTTGELCKVDKTINFTTETDGSDYTYKYEKDSDMYNEFSYDKGAAYTWTTYVEAPEDTKDGETYKFILQSIGATASMSICRVNEDGSLAKNDEGKILRYGTCSGGTDNQGTNWFSSDIVTKTGQSLSSVSVKNVKKGQRFLVTISSATKFEEKDMQVGLAWVTPSDARASKEGAIEEAKKANTTSVVFAYTGTASVGNTLEETTLKLDSDQQDMINAVAKAAHEAGNKVVVALQSPQQVVMEDWIDNVDGVIMMYYAGQRGGAAIANILTGKVNPSGHLAYTIPAKDTDTIITYSQEAFDTFKYVRDLTEEESAYENQGGSWGPGAGGFPWGGGSTGESQYADDPDGVTSSSGGWGFGGGNIGEGQTNEIKYTEGIFTDYRFFDKQGITPAYDFGYGLSYTTFEYSDMKVTPATKDGEKVGFDVTVKVTNTGDVAGKDVAQVYLGEATVPAGVQMAKYQLAGFQKTKELAPGKSQELTIHVSERSLSYWDEDANYTTRADGTKDKWTVAEGNRKIYVGTASDDLIFDKKVDVSIKGCSVVENGGGVVYVPDSGSTTTPSENPVVDTPSTITNATSVTTKVDTKVVTATAKNDVFVDAAGKTITNAIVKTDDGNRYIVDETGKKYVSSIVKTKNGSKFITADNGVIVTGKIVTVDGRKFYTTKSTGKVVTNKIFKVNGKKYVAKKSGVLVTKAWVKIGNKKYYCNSKGVVTKSKKIK